jgi:hypothetical protein
MHVLDEKAACATAEQERTSEAGNNLLLGSNMSTIHNSATKHTTSFLHRGE